MLPADVLDDSAASFSPSSGVWSQGTGSSYYNSSYKTGEAEGSSGAPQGTASWTFSNLQPGLYQIAADYAGNSANSASAPYTLLDGTTSLGTVTVNHR